MNLPNKLTVLRVILVPAFMFFILFELPGGKGELLSRLIAAAVFSVASLTDYADGKIARKRGLITDFGKFMDPLADKFMIFGAIFAFAASPMYQQNAALRVGVIVSGTVVIFRELAVTSIRLVAASGEKPVVIAASWLGKAKTVSQIVYVLTLILEPLLFPFLHGALSWLTLAAMTVLTVVSGYDYIKTYWPYLSDK